MRPGRASDVPAPKCGLRAVSTGTVENSTIAVEAPTPQLVEGGTLADRIKQGAIPVDAALKLALQIAEALEAAHGKGVVHRDLTPSNVKIATDGAVKLLDFGLAKATPTAPHDGDAPLRSANADPTHDGLILGTGAYMSPEQARGQAVDKRTDIWAFGCVLFEMLTGRRAFSGETISDTIAAILNDAPPSLEPHDAAANSRSLRLTPFFELRKRVNGAKTFNGLYLPDIFCASTDVKRV